MTLLDTSFPRDLYLERVQQARLERANRIHNRKLAEELSEIMDIDLNLPPKPETESTIMSEIKIEYEDYYEDKDSDLSTSTKDSSSDDEEGIREDDSVTDDEQWTWYLLRGEHERYLRIMERTEPEKYQDFLENQDVDSEAFLWSSDSTQDYIM